MSVKISGNDPKICCEYLQSSQWPIVNSTPKPSTKPPSSLELIRETYYFNEDSLDSSFESDYDQNKNFQFSKSTSSQTVSRLEKIHHHYKSYFNHPNAYLLNHKKCGPVSSGFRIFGGTRAKIFEFPWMVLLGYIVNYSDGEAIEFRCGGTIINELYIMTAAHCIVYQSSYCS